MIVLSTVSALFGVSGKGPFAVTLGDFIGEKTEYRNMMKITMPNPMMNFNRVDI
jgi:hypothetical protein